MAITTAIRQWSQSLVEDLALITGEIIKFMPDLIVAVLALLVGWIAAKILERLVFLALQAMNFDEFLARGPVDYDALESFGSRLDTPARMASLLVFWSTFFWFGLAPAAGLLRLDFAQVLVKRLLSFTPAALTAALILAAAVFIGDLIRRMISSLWTTSGLPFGRELGWAVWILLTGFGISLGLVVLGLRANIFIPGIGAVAATVGLALAIGFGIGARDLFGAIAAGQDLRNRLAEGDEVAIENYSGTIEHLGLDSVELRTPTGLVSIPNNLFVQKAVVKKGQERRAA